MFSASSNKNVVQRFVSLLDCAAFFLFSESRVCNNKTWKYISNSTTWRLANLRCAEMGNGYELATLYEKADLSCMSRIELPSTVTAWVGFRNGAPQKDFVWFNGQTVSAILNNEKDMCGHVNANEDLNVKACGSKRPFLCKRPSEG